VVKATPASHVAQSLIRFDGGREGGYRSGGEEVKAEIEIKRWSAEIGPLFGIDALGEDRKLSFHGDAKILGDLRDVACQVLLYAGNSAGRDGEYGTVRLYRNAREGLFLRALINLPTNLWEELWRRSAAPPPKCIVRFETEASEDAVFTTDCPIFQPHIELNSN
jgi:hypothetical protein